MAPCKTGKPNFHAGSQCQGGPVETTWVSVMEARNLTGKNQNKVVSTEQGKCRPTRVVTHDNQLRQNAQHNKQM